MRRAEVPGATCEGLRRARCRGARCDVRGATLRRFGQPREDLLRALAELLVVGDLLGNCRASRSFAEIVVRDGDVEPGRRQHRGGPWRCAARAARSAAPGAPADPPTRGSSAISFVYASSLLRCRQVARIASAPRRSAPTRAARRGRRRGRSRSRSRAGCVRAIRRTSPARHRAAAGGTRSGRRAWAPRR